MQAFKSGPIADVDINEKTFNWAKRRYYELMKWDPDTAVPRQECLKNLELDGLLEEVKVQIPNNEHN